MNLEDEIRSAINRVSAENVSNTPDFILAQYLMACLRAFDVAVCTREAWYGRPSGSPTQTSVDNLSKSQGEP